MNKMIIGLWMILIFIGCSSIQAGYYRLDGMQGRYMVPDPEFDPVYINPVYLTYLSGVHIILDAGVEAYSLNGEEEDYLNINPGDPTNNIRFTSIKSTTLQNSEIGILYGGSAFSFGILAVPDYYNYEEEVISDPNDQTNNILDETYRRRITRGSVMNARALMAFDLGVFSFGLSGLYQTIPELDLRKWKTNGREDLTLRQKDDSDLIMLGGDLGFLFTDQKSFSLGLNGGYLTGTGVRYSDVHFVPTNDSYIADTDYSSSMISAGLELEGRLSSARLLRFIARTEISTSLESFNPYDEYKFQFNATNRDDFMQYSGVSQRVDMTFLKTGLRAQSFIGLELMLGQNDLTFHYDTDDTADPVFAGTDYEESILNRSTEVNLVLGAEGLVLDKLIIRGGLKSTLLGVYNDEYTRTDAYDPIEMKVQDFVFPHNRQTSYSFLSSLSMSAGMTLKLGPDSDLDLSAGFDVFGVNVSSGTDEWDLTRHSFDPDKHNPKDTERVTDVRINMALNFIL